MKISAKAEYACVAMLELAANHADGQPVRIKSIGDTHGIPNRFLVQILLQLKTAGLATSVRGAAGGYQLARAPHTISLADILGAVEQRAIVPRARKSTAKTSDVPSVATRVLGGIWKEIQQEEQRILRERTLEDLLRASRQSNSLMYEI